MQYKQGLYVPNSLKKSRFYGILNKQDKYCKHGLVTWRITDK